MKSHCREVAHGGPLQGGEPWRHTAGRYILEAHWREVDHGGTLQEVDAELTYM